jgi:OOP family OmpA-OmpF porin
MRSRAAAVAASVLAVSAPAVAGADAWLTADVPAAVPVSQPQNDVFRGGTLPAIGLYLPTVTHVDLAVRARAGVLVDGSAPMEGLADPGWGGLGTLAFAVRVSGARPWLEVAAGGGLTGTDIVPAIEIGAGWSTRAGAVDLGPSLRFLHVQADDGPGLGSADLLLLGIEVRRSRSRRERVRVRPPSVAAATKPAPVAAAIVESPDVAEPDHDAIVDTLDSCRVLVGVIEGGVAGAGCTGGGPIQIEADRIILAEQVLFAVRRARVRHAARPVMHAIAGAWERGDWQRIIIEGHADVRGSAEYNLWLSQLRAERARAALIDAGVPADAIEAVGFGLTRPRSPVDHGVNRRVEFVIVTRGATPAAGQP